MSGCCSPFWRQAFVVSSMCLNAVGNGCVVSFTAILLPKITDPKNDLYVSDATASWIASTLGIGIIVGTAIVPFTMHKFGRKPSQVLSTLPSIPAWFAIAFAQNATTLIIAKCAQGIGFGMYSMLSPIFIGEVTSSKYRGMFLGFITFGWTTGMLLGYLIGTLFQWRTAAMICSTFQTSTLLISLFIPESPHWLVSKLKFDKSEMSFRWLRSQTEKRELDSLILAQKLKNTNRLKPCCSTIIDVVKDQAFYKPLLILLNFCLIFHGTGTEVIVNAYCTFILKKSIDFSNEISYNYIMITLGLIRLLASVLVIYVSRRFTRRSSILTTNALMVLSLTSISLYLYLKSANLTSSVFDWIPVLFLYVYSFTMYIGIFPFTYTISGEILPMVYKPIGTFIMGIFKSAVFFVIVKSAASMFSVLGIHGTFLVYAGIGSVCSIYIYFALPETKGKTLQQIEEFFTGERVPEKNVEEMKTILKANNSVVYDN